MDKYVTAENVEVLSKEISLSNMAEFNQYIEDEKNGLSQKSKAAAIAAQTSKVISERYHQDEVFYKKFSDRIKALLEELKTARKEDISALYQEIKDIQKQVENYEDNDIPEEIRTLKVYHPFYRNIKSLIPDVDIDEETFIGIVCNIVDIIKRNKIVDFEYNIDIRRKILILVEDYLFDDVDIKLTGNQIQVIAEKCWDLAIENKDIL